MKLIFVTVCVLAFLGLAHGRLSPDSMRRALQVSPLFSHQRDSAVPLPQNVNINLPMGDTPLVNNEPSLVQSLESSPKTNNRPATAESNRQNVGPVKTQNTNQQPIRAMRPVLQDKVMGQVAETRLSQQQPTTSVQEHRGPVRQQRIIGNQAPVKKAGKPASAGVNDRLLNSVKPAATAASAAQATDSKQECAFKIPSFLLPDPDPSQVGSSQRCPSFLLPGPSINPQLVNLMVEHWTGVKQTTEMPLNSVRSQITQIEFEQKCLIPALRAHVLGGSACRTRELKVYMEWLLYLRQRLFNI